MPNQTATRGLAGPLPAPEPGALLLARLAQAACLREGAEGARAVLRAIVCLKPATTRAVARACRLPVPVVAALRREMERAGFLTRGHGMELTPAGRDLVDSLGLGATWAATCGACEGRRIALSRERRALVTRLQRRQRSLPPPDLALDQAHSLPESSLRRALYMAETGALDGRAILCLGDDDCVSLALALLRPGASRIVVLDCDRRLLDWLAETAAEEGLALECVAHDLREPLPQSLRGAFDVFQTDPPYTEAGLKLFLARAVEALRPAAGGMGFLSYAHRAPREQQEIARVLVNAGFAIEEIIPDFNEYAGAAILGNRGQILRLRAAGPLTPPVRGRYAGPLYTAECRKGGALRSALGTRPVSRMAVTSADCPPSLPSAQRRAQSAGVKRP